MDKFFDFISLPRVNLEERCIAFVNKCKTNQNYALNCVFRFINFQKERLEKNEIVASTIYNYLKPIKLLCEINDIPVKWKRVTMGLPKERKYAEDRSPTTEEIRRLIDYPDRRIRGIVLTMVSSGIRLAAWDDLKVKHVQPIRNNDDTIQAAKIVIYAGSEEQYFSFITPEAHSALTEWIEFRKVSGENITDESWLMRNLWDVNAPNSTPSSE